MSDARLETRGVYLGGLIGQLASVAIWLASALAPRISLRHGVLLLVLGCGAARLTP